jgi:hypothetical protein
MMIDANDILARLARLKHSHERLAQCQSHFSSFIFLQTIAVCPVFESIFVVTGRQLQDTVFAFSCLITTQCSISSAVGGGIWLRIGAIGRCLAAQPTRNRKEMSHSFFIATATNWPNSSR